MIDENKSEPSVGVGARLCYDLQNKRLFIDNVQGSTDLDALAIFGSQNDSSFIYVAPLNKNIIKKGKTNLNWIEIDEYFKARVAEFEQNPHVKQYTRETMLVALKQIADIRDQQYFQAKENICER